MLWSGRLAHFNAYVWVRAVSIVGGLDPIRWILLQYHVPAVTSGSCPKYV